jgi:hypothetical protein
MIEEFFKAIEELSKGASAHRRQRSPRRAPSAQW